MNYPRISMGTEFGQALVEHFGLPAHQVSADLQITAGANEVFGVKVDIMLTPDDLAAIADRMPGRTLPSLVDAKLSEFLGDAPAPAAAPEPAVVGEMVVKLDIDTSSIDALSARLDEMRQKFGAAAEGVIASFAKAGIATQ